MKKVVALVLAAIMLLSLTSALAEKETLTLWSIATEADANYQTYIDALKDLNAANEKYEIVMEATENEAYKTKIKAAMSAGEGLPDIFFTWSMSFLGDFVEAGRVYCLDDVLPAYKAELTDAMLANTNYDGKQYGIPLVFNVVTLFANMDLLKKAGWETAPATYDELMKCCDDLLAAGIIPFGVAGKENWCLSEYTEPLLVKTIGAKGLENCYTGVDSWNQEGVIRAMTIFTDMIHKGYFDPNASALGNEETKQNFLAGKYAFYQNGSWNCGEVAAAGENFVALPFPVIDPEKASLYEMVGGPNDSLAVTASSKNAADAAVIAMELGRAISKGGNLNGAGMPGWAVNYDASSVNRVSNSVAEMVAQSSGMVLFGDNFLSADAANTYLDYIANLFAGNITATEFAEGLAADLQ